VLSLSANNPDWGVVDPGSGFYPVGTLVELTATAANYFRFVQWAGAYSATNDPLTISLQTNVILQAQFGEIVTTNHAIPYWWLAANGYTQDMENAELLIGLNGMAVWESYVAGLNPNDPSSQLRIRLEREISATNPVLRWNTVTGRVYSVLQSTNISSGFSIIASNLPATIQSFTNPAISSSATFYRLKITKP
jgi:hypothetical protein